MNKLNCHLSVSHFAGHLAYLAAVRVDAAYNNPVMNVFVYLLSQGTTSHKSTSTYVQFYIILCVFLCVRVCTC